MATAGSRGGSRWPAPAGEGQAAPSAYKLGGELGGKMPFWGLGVAGREKTPWVPGKDPVLISGTPQSHLTRSTALLLLAQD